MNIQTYLAAARPVIGFCRVAGLVLLAAMALQLLVLYLFQDKIIYHPHPYPPGKIDSFPRKLVRLSYTVDNAPQVAFYAPPAGGVAPAHVWVFFSGNGGLVLDYTALTGQPALAGDGFLMVDYPGYGLNGGKPSPQATLDSARAALGQLAAHLSIPPEELDQRLGVAGHSLGAAAALSLAISDPAIRRIVLISPFTSLCAMAWRTVGYPVCALVRHDQDNEAALNTLAARDPRPEVAIFHGDADRIIPVNMSRTMAAEHPGWIAYREVPDVGHNDIPVTAAPEIASVMVGMDGSP